MKKTIHKILHWLNLGIVALMLLLVVLLSALYFFSSQFDKYRHDFEQFASKVISQPIEVGTISVGSRGLEPALKLEKVVIFNDAKTKKILEARELQIGIDLIGSLLKWQIKPGLLLVRGSELTVYQDKSGKVELVGISSEAAARAGTDSAFDEIASWLFEQSRIDLEDIGLKWHLADGKVIQFTDLYLRLHNGVLQHDLKISGKLVQQDSPAIFETDFKLHGDVLKNHAFPLVGDVKIANWSHEFDSAPLSGDHLFMPLSGDINLLVKNSRIITKFFRQPMLINKLGANVVWQRDGNDLKVNVGKLEFNDDWLSFYGGSQFLFQAESMVPTVDMKLNFKLTNLAKAKLYYPVTALPTDATAWLDQAFTSSKLFSGNMILQGPLDKFPFDKGEGKFLIDSTIRDVDLHYDPEWPKIEKISGKMSFVNRSMTIIANSAKILQAPVKLIKAVIPDLEFPVLYIDGAIDTNSSVGLKFVKASPLKNTLGRKLQDLSLSGPMKFDLKMKLTLSDDLVKKENQVSGNIELHNNHLSSKDWGFDVNDIQGNLHFNDGDLVASGIHGKLFDKQVELNISTLDPEGNDAVTRVNLSAKATVQDLERAFAVNISPYAFGDFSYDAVLDLHSASVQNVFKLHSNLLGVGVDLPSPFDKKSGSQSEFNLIGYFGGNKTPQVTINYNDQIGAALLVKKDPNGKLQLVAGEIKFGDGLAKVSATHGLVIAGSLNELDWPVWKEYLSKTKTNVSEAGSLIRQVGLKIAKLQVLGQVFNQVSLQAQPKNNGWEIAFLMPDIDGKIYFPKDDRKTIQGDFTKLYFDDEKQKNITSFKPQDLPPLNFKIDNLRYGDKRLNRVTFVTEPQAGGLKINKLTIRDPKYVIEASGEWLAVDNNQRSILRGNISSDDVGGLLKQWDLTDAVAGGKGGANFILKWPDSIYKPTMLTASGGFAVRVTNGRIINLSKSTENKLGLGRVLGMLSLQSLPRRLTFDFSDLTQSGFSFDTMEGNFELGDGNIRVKKLSIDGPVANVKARGRIGIKQQDYDLMLSAVPRLTSSIPIAAAIAINPVVGAIGFVADRVISSAMKKSSIYTYHVTGQWATPEVKVAAP